MSCGDWCIMPQEKKIEAQDVGEEEIGEWPRRRKFGVWHYVVIGCLVALFLVAVVWTWRAQTVHMQKVLTRQELWQIRHAVFMYLAIHGELPPDLNTLTMEMVRDPDNEKGFPLLDRIKSDSEGRLIDQFGRPYIYDRSSGQVKSQSPCCLKW